MKKLLQLLGILVCALLFVQLALAQAPTFSPAGGAFTSAQSVTITCGSGQTAAYTLDGSTPNLASAKYTGPVSVASTATLKAICANIQVDYQNTQASSTGYKCVTPNAATYGSLHCEAGGGVGSIQPSNVTLTFGTTMNYAMSTTASSSETQSLVPFLRTGCDSCNYMAQDFYVEAVGDNTIIANNEMDMVDFNNTYNTNHQIGLQCNQQSGKHRWQIDSDGGTGWLDTNVTEGCDISTTQYTHVALTAHWTNGDTSGPRGHGYTCYDTLTINGHDHSLVSMGCQPNSATSFNALIGNQSQIDLTNTAKSGHNPTTGGRNIQNNNVAASIGPPSAITSANYSISASGTAAATPSINPGGGFYSTTQTVTMADSTVGAVIHYTTDGSLPTCSSSAYSSALSISTTTTVKAIACATGFANSSVASAVYTFSGSGGLTATPTFSPTGGSYTSTQYVILSDTTSGAVIYYTTDGSTPTPASNAYSSPLAVSATATIKAMAVAPGLTNSSVASATYTITSTLVASTPTFSPGTGNYTGTQTVTISDSTPSPTIYYTTDGSTPTTSSTVYSTPISVTATKTVKAIATASGYSTSLVGAATYTIGCGLTPYVTGNIDPTQLKGTGRQGAGPLVQMGSGGFTTNDLLYYDCNGDATDSGTLLSALATKSGVQQQSYTYAADTGSANAYAVTLSPAPTIVAGSHVVFKAANANTGASTLAVNGGSATAIKKQGATALASGDIASGQIVEVVYDGTNYQMLASSSSGGSSPLTTKGDTYGFNTGPARVPVGLDGYVYTADSTQPLGVKWAAASGGSVPTAISTQPDWPPSSPTTYDDEFTGSTLASQWTWLNQGTATGTLANNSWIAMALPGQSSGTVNVRGIYETAPTSTPWSVTAKVSVNGTIGNYVETGIVLRQSSTGKVITFGAGYRSGQEIDVIYWSSPTTFSTLAMTGYVQPFMPMYFRVQDDGTNLNYSYSRDGIAYIQVFTSSRTAFFTGSMDGVGVGGYTEGVAGAGNIIVTADWFRKTQ